MRLAGGKLLAQPLFGLGQARRYGAFRHSQHMSYLAVGVTVVVAQNDSCRLVRGQVAQGVNELTAQTDRRCIASLGLAEAGLGGSRRWSPRSAPRPEPGDCVLAKD